MLSVLTLELSCVCFWVPEWLVSHQTSRLHPRQKEEGQGEGFLLMSFVFEFGKGSHPLEVAWLPLTEWNWVSSGERT